MPRGTQADYHKQVSLILMLSASLSETGRLLLRSAVFYSLSYSSTVSAYSGLHCQLLQFEPQTCVIV